MIFSNEGFSICLLFYSLPCSHTLKKLICSQNKQVVPLFFESFCIFALSKIQHGYSSKEKNA